MSGKCALEVVFSLQETFPLVFTKCGYTSFFTASNEIGKDTYALVNIDSSCERRIPKFLLNLHFDLFITVTVWDNVVLYCFVIIIRYLKTFNINF